MKSQLHLYTTREQFKKFCLSKHYNQLLLNHHFLTSVQDLRCVFHQIKFKGRKVEEKQSNCKVENKICYNTALTVDLSLIFTRILWLHKTYAFDYRRIKNPTCMQSRTTAKTLSFHFSQQFPVLDPYCCSVIFFVILRENSRSFQGKEVKIRITNSLNRQMGKWKHFFNIL